MELSLSVLSFGNAAHDGRRANPESGGRGAQAPAMPLSLRRAGEVVTVSRVRGDEAMRKHLVEIGFVVGASVRVVSDGPNVIVAVKGARFGVDPKVAQLVMTI
ncbi:MAG: FeoA family protein [Collinsella sp.]|nr:FeoA family protein [Collinsella sp.]